MGQGALPLHFHENVAVATPFHHRPVFVRGFPAPQARDELRTLDPSNAESLQTVESALFVVSFEDGVSNDLEVLARACLHGSGRNKWFDKPFNLVVFKNGRVGVNGEVRPRPPVSAHTVDQFEKSGFANAPPPSLSHRKIAAAWL